MIYMRQPENCDVANAYVNIYMHIMLFRASIALRQIIAVVLHTWVDMRLSLYTTTIKFLLTLFCSDSHVVVLYIYNLFQKHLTNIPTNSNVDLAACLMF